MNINVDELMKKVYFSECPIGYTDLETGESHISAYEIKGSVSIKSAFKISDKDYNDLYQKDPYYRRTLRKALTTMMSNQMMNILDISDTDFKKLSMVRMIPLEDLYKMCKKYEDKRWGK